MADREIIRALECCQTKYNRKCECCPYEKYQTRYISAVTCESGLREDLLNFVDRQKEESENLKVELRAMKGAARSYKKLYHEAKTEAIKAFVKRLKSNTCRTNDGHDMVDMIFVNNLANEMTKEA